MNPLFDIPADPDTPTSVFLALLLRNFLDLEERRR